MPELSVDFDVYCSCGAPLCDQTDVSQDRYGAKLTVEPCQKCLDEARDNGFNDGWKEGTKEQKGGEHPLTLN